MQKLVERTTGALLRAVDLLSTEFKVHSWDFLPYEAILIVLCYIFSQIEQIAATHVRRIRQWFWRSAFSERYRVGGENFVTKDLEAVMKFVRDNGEPNAYGSSLSADQLVKNAFRSNNSRSRAYILALAARKPRNLTNGATIDTAEALSQFNKKQFHHIYPRAFLRRIGCREDDNVLANICMLAAAENNAVSDSDPNIYLPALSRAHDAHADAILESNLMPSRGVIDYTTASYAVFAAARSHVLSEFIMKLCHGD